MIIDRLGVVNKEENKNGEVNKNSIENCKLILTYIVERTEFQDNMNSYNYKHRVEKFFNDYVGSGDFISAALALNLSIKLIPFQFRETHTDVIFKFTENDFKLAMIKYITRNDKLQLSLNDSYKIKKEIENSKGKRSYIEIKDIISLYKKLNVNLTYKDIFLLFNTELDFFDWTMNHSNQNTEEGLLTTVHLKVNKNKLIKILKNR